MSLKKVIASIRKNKSFVITTHTNLEGDALGSQLAFYRLIRKLGRQARIINEDGLPYGYEFMPGVGVIKKFNKRVFNIKFDCFVILDCSDLARCGKVANLVSSDRKTVINIDHHISNGKFADSNWVDACASSCSEMIYRLYQEMRVPLDKDTAVALYVGILTDTGSFRYTNTSWRTHAIVSQLLKYNLDIPQIYKNIYANIPYPDIKLLSKVLPDIRRDSGGRIAWFALKHNLLGHKKLSFDLSEYLLSFARSIKDTEVAILFRENRESKDEIRVNFRSQGKVDVNRIASFFGGGGHRTASGCTIKGRLETISKKVLDKVKEVL